MKFAIALCAFVTLAAAAIAAPPPKPAPHSQNQLDALFAKLAKAGSAENAKPIEEQILTLFNQSGSASVDLLMVHAAAAQHANDDATAKQIIVTVTEIAPNYAEGWHARAAIAQANKDDANALAYLQKTVTLNPRQFQACTELAGILASYGDKKQALQYFRKAQTLDPYYEGIDKEVNDLARQVEGEKI